MFTIVTSELGRCPGLGGVHRAKLIHMRKLGYGIAAGAALLAVSSCSLGQTPRETAAPAAATAPAAAGTLAAPAAGTPAAAVAAGGAVSAAIAGPDLVSTPAP